MAKRLLTECPYCHRKVSYFGAGILKTKGEHSCTGCKCISNVVIHRTLYGIGGGAVVLSLILVLVFSAYMEHDNIWGIIFVLLPYLIFYIIAPFFIKLEPCNDKSAVNKLRRKVEPVPEEKREPLRKIQQPIELNVGDEFSSSFMKAKSSIKAIEENFSEEYSEEFTSTDGDMDINSGIDIDISSEIRNENNFPGNGTSQENDEKKYEPPTVADELEAGQIQNVGDEVSFMLGGTVTEEKAVGDEDLPPLKIEDVGNHEVSFIYGKPHDESNN